LKQRSFSLSKKQMSRMTSNKRRMPRKAAAWWYQSIDPILYYREDPSYFEFLFGLDGIF
jgi:hypothetical protein